MKKGTFETTLILILFTSLIACSQGNGQEDIKKDTYHGMEYIIHINKDKARIKKGDVVTFHQEIIDPYGNVQLSTYRQERPNIFKIDEPDFKGDMIDGLSLLGEGDSATFYILADSLYKDLDSSTWSPGDRAEFIVKIMKVQSAEEYNEEIDQFREEMTEQTNTRVDKDLELIKTYLKENRLKADLLDDGFYYKRTKKGKGEKPKAGDNIKFHYRMAVINGVEVDNSFERGHPMQIPVGMGRVNVGLDKLLLQMEVGERGKAYIPSTLCYGAKGVGDKIPPNSNMIYEVELVEIDGR